MPSADASGAPLLGCSRCLGSFCAAAYLGRVLGGPVDGLAKLTSGQGLAGGAAGFCPSDDGGLLVRCLPERLDDCYRCDQCGALFCSVGALAVLRRLLAPARGSRPATSPEPPLPVARTGEEPILAEARLGYGNPWVDLLTLPISLLLSALVSFSWFGRLLLFPVQIQFHELGHALPAWLSGRAALPLPFGFTFWREQQSLWTTLLMLLLAGLFVWRGARESRPFAMLVGTALVLATIWLSWVVPTARSRMIVIVGGGAGELLLPCLLLVSFYFPLPDRLRWDFFRFLVVLPAAGSFWASLRMWLAVRDGSQAMPIGSLLGREGSGDLERLIAEYDFSAPELADLYLQLSVLAAALLLATYGTFALRSLRTLRSQIAGGAVE